MNPMPILPCCIALALLPPLQTQAATTSHTLIPEMSGYIHNFSYLDPNSNQTFIIDIGATQNLTGGHELTNPTPNGNGSISSFLLGFNATGTDVVTGKSVIITSEITAGTSNSAGKDIQTGSLSFSANVDGEKQLFNGSFFRLFNAPGYLNPFDLAEDPTTEAVLAALGLPSVADTLNNALQLASLPSDWTALDYYSFGSTNFRTLSSADISQVADHHQVSLDPLQILGITDNGDGTYLVPINTVGSNVNYSRSPFDSFINAPAPGSFENPLMPVGGGVNTEGFEFSFFIPPGCIDESGTLNCPTVWFDPEIAIGYEYEVNSGPLFQSVQLPIGIGDNLFDLFLYDELNDTYSESPFTLTGGGTFTFNTGGVDRFLVRGIETDVMLDPEDPLAFQTGFTFAGTGEGRISQTPITVEVASVPEPGILVLFGSGLLIMGWGGRRRRILHRRENKESKALP